VVWHAALAVVAVVLLVAVRPTLGGAMCAMTPEEREGLRQLLKDG
jgi:hypothetical protein